MPMLKEGLILILLFMLVEIDRRQTAAALDQQQQQQNGQTSSSCKSKKSRRWWVRPWLTEQLKEGEERPISSAFEARVVSYRPAVLRQLLPRS